MSPANQTGFLNCGQASTMCPSSRVAGSRICHSCRRSVEQRTSEAQRSAPELADGKPRSGHPIGGEQGSVDGPSACQRLDVDHDVSQGVEPLHRVALAYFGPFDAPGLGLTIDAFGTGTLAIDRAVE